MAGKKTTTYCTDGTRNIMLLIDCKQEVLNNFIIYNKISTLDGGGDEVGCMLPQKPSSNPTRTYGQHIPKTIPHSHSLCIVT